MAGRDRAPEVRSDSADARPSAPGRSGRRLTQAERTARSDARMFNAAMALISEQGANRTTLKEICETAGYSRGLATYRFGSKDNFLQELLKHFNRAWVKQLRSATKRRQGLDALLAAVDALERFLLEHPRYMRGSYVIWYESIGSNNAVREQLARNHRFYRRDVARWLREGIDQGSVRPSVDAEQFAVFYLTFVSGTIYQWLVAPEAVDLKAMFAYFRGMARRELEPPG